ncbi:MAG: urea carboxylase-associated protein [Erythrobacteraceae bacterium]|uniref:Urea carboxylase-associated family protein n=1 Tax=Qipengyuania pacifica TaxID=2860199 RepID=A0ABS7JHJ2_9SPHN|nr:urea carboxylase-associated family protein [Qipengyuania aerophila]MAP67942.1 urea carboxylase-associated protein [Erythrobacteraceae bacterium]MBX7489479.1 urea carboxylase-associated family protein [Qipengyuania aerophila]|tara:strand:+ start:765 stop:1370 length:606 start_codon:yes stop_codon:yes gene_type:complete
MNPNRIAPRSGVAFRLEEGETLTVVDPQGGQVSDLLAFNADDVREVISNGRTFDYEETISLGQGNRLWSNRSKPMLEIVEDTVGRHDFLLTPCSEATFRHFYADKPVHRGCFGNLAEALSPYGVEADMIPTAFNLFMNVPVDGATGRLAVEPPVSKSGDHISMRALSPLIIGLTACSAYDSCGGTFKPIDYAIDRPTAGVT